MQEERGLQVVGRTAVSLIYWSRDRRFKSH